MIASMTVTVDLNIRLSEVSSYIWMINIALNLETAGEISDAILSGKCNVNWLLL